MLSKHREGGFDSVTIGNTRAHHVNANAMPQHYRPDGNEKFGVEKLSYKSNIFDGHGYRNSKSRRYERDRKRNGEKNRMWNTFRSFYYIKQ